MDLTHGSVNFGTLVALGFASCAEHSRVLPEHRLWAPDVDELASASDHETPQEIELILMQTSPRNTVVAATVVLSSIGFAQDARAAGVGENKAGPFMGNVKIGPAVGLDDDFGGRGVRGGPDPLRYYRGTQFALELELAYAVDAKENAYIGFNPQFHVSDYFAVINLTGTFQYDIQIIENKLKGFYLYPKVNAGVGIVPNDADFQGRGFCSGCDADVYFDLQLVFGAKFNIWENFHVLAEPLNFPLYIGEQFGAQYRFFVGCGFDL